MRIVILAILVLLSGCASHVDAQLSLGSDVGSNSALGDDFYDGGVFDPDDIM